MCYCFILVDCFTVEPDCIPNVVTITSCTVWDDGTGGGESNEGGYDYPPAPTGGGGQNPTGTNNPCEKIKLQNQSPAFKGNLSDLKGKTSLKKETGYIQKASGGFDYNDNASATDNSNSLGLPDSKTKTWVTGYMHTHVDDYTVTDADGQEQIRIGIQIFSPADMAYFMDMLKNAQNAGRPLGDVYAIMVSSGQTYQIRFTGNQYQIRSFTETQLTDFKTQYIEFMKSRIGNAKKLELGFLDFISEKMNLKSVALYKMNKDGTNTEIKMTADKKDTTEANCLN